MSRARLQSPERVDLPNGMRVLLVENHATPAISLSLTFPSGSRDEPEDCAGLAMMTSRLLDEGTRSRTSLEIADAIESVGGAIDTDCCYDRIAVFLTVVSRDIEVGLGLVGDIVRNPAFPEASIRNECERTLAEIESALDRPQVVANQEFNELVYRGHPLHRPVHGYPATITGITRQHLEAFHSRHVVPDNAILSVVGDFDTARMRSRIESVFGDWTTDPGARTQPAAPERTQGVTRRFLELPGQQAHVYYGHLGIPRTHPDYYTLQVMDTILGSGAGLASRIPNILRDEMGLAYTTFSTITNSAGVEPGRFVVYIATSPKHVGAAIDGFMREIDRIRSAPVLEEELLDAQAHLTGSFVFAFETNSQIARFLVNAELFGLGFDYVDRYPDLIRSVSADMVLEAAARHLSTRDYVLVVAGPREARPGVWPSDD